MIRLFEKTSLSLLAIASVSAIAWGCASHVAASHAGALPPEYEEPAMTNAIDAGVVPPNAPPQN